MKILFLSQLLPLPLDAGPKIRAHFVLRYLAEAGHEVTLACFVRPGDRRADVEAVGRFCRRLETVPIERSRWRDVRAGLASLVGDTPFLILRDRIADMTRRVDQLCQQQDWDAVHADQLWMAPYAESCRQIPFKVLDQHNAVFRVPERLAEQHRNPAVRVLLRREAAKLARVEREALSAFSRVAWVTKEDLAAFLPDPRSARRDVVIPIAVDPLACQPIERPRPFRVTFLGGVHWPPNADAVTWFADRIWPRIVGEVPHGVFTIIGRGAPARLRNVPGIEVAGYVDDPGPYLAETAAFVVPLRSGAGMRVKILDAWCWGLPVVSTTVGAEGVLGAHGENLLLADDPSAFAEHVVRLLRDPEASARLGRNGRATAESAYDWRTVYQAWDEVYR